ncbi:MAG: hypothetical protein LBP98_06580 [Tannerella sp.]|jgi:hypothetical protein|nr:hypothetical protein [Tannerella sp.]
MKKNLFARGLLAFAVLLFPGCGDGTHGGSDPDDGEPAVTYPEGSLLMLKLNPEEDVFDGFASDGDTDIGILNDSETGKLFFSVVTDRETEESFGILFSDEGYPVLYIHDNTYFVMNNFSGTRADMAVIDEAGEVTVYRDMETGVDWDSGFYERWNATDTRAIDWGRLGDAFYEEFKADGRLVLIGIGYGIKAIPAMMGMRYGDPTAYLDFATNFMEMLDEAIPDNRYIQTTRLALEAGSTASAAMNLLKCRTDPSYCMSNIMSGLYDAAGGLLTDLERPEVEENLLLADDILTSGHGPIQVTLTWYTDNDLDLHVTDPNGERIYWNHKTSASGGYLDRDNRKAYSERPGSSWTNGPENIYWHDPKLTGHYRVYVHHYAGTANSNYTVYINAFGRADRVDYSIGPGGKHFVAVFDDKAIYRDVSTFANLPNALTVFGKKPPETELYRDEAKTGLPDFRKLKERLSRRLTGVSGNPRFQ